MAKKSKLVYIIGSIAIGVVALITVLGVLIAGGFVNVATTKLVLSSASKEFVFDGTAHKEEGWELTQGSLKEGHTLVVVHTGSQTDVGSSLNYITATVVDESKVDVSDYYEFAYQYGTLSVVPHSLHVVSETLSKEYDGEPLQGSGYTLTQGTLPEGYTLNVQFSGSITDAGTTQNAFSVGVFDGEGADKTASFAITTTVGSLTVTPRALEIKTDGGEKVYDGTPLTVDTYTVTDEAERLIEGHTLGVTLQGAQTTVGSGENTAAVTITDGAGTDVTANYALTVEVGELKVTPRILTVTTNGGEKTYDGTPLTVDTHDLTSGSLVEGHTLNVVKNGTQTEAGSSKNTALTTVTDGESNDVTGNYSITLVEGELKVLPRLLELTTGEAGKTYDGTPLVEDSYTVTRGELVPDQTLTVRVIGKQVNVGESENGATAYITDGAGTDVTKNYDVQVIAGTLKVELRLLEITTGSASKPYDGEPLTEDSYTITGGSLAPNQHEVVDVTGMQVGSGSSPNTATVSVQDAEGRLYTDNYDIRVIEGTLTIAKPTITVKTHSATKEYDGTPLTEAGYEITGDITAGKEVTVVNTGTQTDVGYSTNVAEVTVNGEPVENFYDVTYELGQLTVTKRAISVQTGGASKVYDGTPLTSDKYKPLGDRLLLGHELVVETLGVQLDVGRSDNRADVVIYDENDRDVTGNYEISVSAGLLEVTPLTIYLTTDTLTKEYDATPLQANGMDGVHFTATSPTLAEGDVIVNAVRPSLTEAGRLNNGVDLQIERDGVDVTGNYTVNVSMGELVVRPRPITVRTADASKVYDGTPLTNDSWAIVSITTPLPIHTVQVAVSGTRTEIGESPNDIAEVLITDEHGENVSHNYDITEQPGTLVVKAASGSGGESPTEPPSPDLSDNGDGSDTVVLRVKAQEEGPVYLRMASYDAYLGNTWGGAIAYDQLLDGTYSMSYLPSFALQATGVSARQVSVDALGQAGMYMTPYYVEAGSGETQTNDTFVTGDSTGIYSHWYYAYDYAYGATLSGAAQYSAEERAYRSFVYANYLDSIESTYPLSYAYLEQVIAEQGFSASDPDIVGKVARYIQSAAKYDLYYDEAMDEETDCVYAFLSTYKAGVCRHYASAATLLFRQLGIPARYTIGFMSNGIAGEWNDLNAGHAWVEVYIDGLGWVYVEVTGGSGGTGSAGGGMEIKPFDMDFEYDGSTFAYKQEYGLQGLSKLTEAGYTYTFTVEGARKDLGVTTTKITSLKIFDPEGVDVTAETPFKLKTGELRVYCFRVSVTTAGASKTYDGAPLTSAGYTVTGLENGHRAEVRTKGSIVNVGKAVNLFDIVIYDSQGKEVTYMYKIDANYGALIITPAKLTVIADSATKQKDGTPLTADGYAFSGSLADGDTVKEVIVEGSQTVAGYSDNVIKSVTIVNGKGEDVTANYLITRVNGKLTVIQ